MTLRRHSAVIRLIITLCVENSCNKISSTLVQPYSDSSLSPSTRCEVAQPTFHEMIQTPQQTLGHECHASTTLMDMFKMSIQAAEAAQVSRDRCCSHREPTPSQSHSNGRLCLCHSTPR